MSQPNSTYRQMELNPKAADGAHSAEDAQKNIEHARAQADYYQQQHIELEKTKRDKQLFAAQLNELGMSIHNITRRLEQEIKDLDGEKQALTEVYQCLTRHLQILSALDPTDWSNEGIKERLLEALPKLDRAENDLNEAYAGVRRYHFTKIFDVDPLATRRWGINWTQLQAEILRGVFFHLPLLVLLVMGFGLWYIFS